MSQTPRQGGATERRWLWTAIGVALFVRLLWMLFASPVPVSDYEVFRQLAQDLVAHGQFGWPQPTAYRFPGYSFFLAFAMRVSTSTSWLRFVTVLLSAGLAPAAYALAKRLANGDGQYGLAAAWVCALDPTFVFWSPILASEHLFTLLVFLGLALVVRGGGPGIASLLLAGLCLGLGCLTRGEGLFQVPTFLLALTLVTPRASWMKRLRDSVVLLLPVVALVGAWAARNAAVVGPGSGISTSGGVNFYMAHGLPKYGYQGDAGSAFENLSEPEASATAYRVSYDELRRDPLRFPRDVVTGTWEQYRPGAYAVSWSARLPKPPGSTVYPEKRIPSRRFFSWIQVLGYAALCMVAAASVLVWGRIPLGLVAVPVSIVAWNWVCYAVIFFANARYRYLGEAAFCLLAGATVTVWSAAWMRRSRARPGYPPDPSPEIR